MLDIIFTNWMMTNFLNVSLNKLFNIYSFFKFSKLHKHFSLCHEQKSIFEFILLLNRILYGFKLSILLFQHLKSDNRQWSKILAKFGWSLRIVKYWFFSDIEISISWNKKPPTRGSFSSSAARSILIWLTTKFGLHEIFSLRKIP